MESYKLLYSYYDCFISAGFVMIISISISIGLYGALCWSWQHKQYLLIDSE